MGAASCRCCEAEDVKSCPADIMDVDTGCSHGSKPAKDEEPQLAVSEDASECPCPSRMSAMSPMSAVQRMKSRSHTEVDYEIMRGIPLHHILRRWEFWTSPDEIRRTDRVNQVWSFSSKVSGAV
eukprot:Skav200692  [mRNA]  locus=scaffold2923:18906:26324:+ [translate_table: standard]